MITSLAGSCAWCCRRLSHGWGLLSVLSVLVSAVEIVAWLHCDWTSSADIQALMGFNWQLSTPYFLMAFCASSMQQVFPSTFSRWLRANRRYIGLAFAVVVGWQFATICRFSLRFPSELVSFHADAFQYLEDSIFIYVGLMVLTSFRFVYRHMSLAAWRHLHKTGIFLLGSLFFSNYLFELTVRSDMKTMIETLAFALAFGLRGVSAWQQSAKLKGRVVFVAGAALSGFGVMLIWDLFGLQTDKGVHWTRVLFMTGVAAALLLGLSPLVLRRRIGGRFRGWLCENQKYFFFILAFNGLLYGALVALPPWWVAGRGLP